MYTLSSNEGKAANEDKEDDDDVVEEVVDDSASKRIHSWDPFNSVVAPKVKKYARRYLYLTF
jgi:hypothetical protein